MDIYTFYMTNIKGYCNFFVNFLVLTIKII